MASRLKRPASAPELPFAILSQLTSEPRRSLGCLNLRREDKSLFDHLHAYWSLVAGRPLSQPDAFRILLEAAMRNPALDAPPGLRELAFGELAP